MTLAELKAMAEAATPGTWKTYNMGEDRPRIVHRKGLIAEMAVNGQLNAAFIAAANPSVVLAMIEEILAWRAYDDAAVDAKNNGFVKSSQPGCEQARAALDAVLKETGNA